nr:preprotein translocase subunit YajC [Ideonella oryzae]
MAGLAQYLPLVIMLVALYFIMIRPQIKQQKEHKAMVDNLTKGDEVVVANGLMGRISKVGESVVHVELAQGVEVQVQRQSVSRVLPKGTLK